MGREQTVRYRRILLLDISGGRRLFKLKGISTTATRCPSARDLCGVISGLYPLSFYVRIRLYIYIGFFSSFPLLPARPCPYCQFAPSLHRSSRLKANIKTERTACIISNSCGAPETDSLWPLSRDDDASHIITPNWKKNRPTSTKLTIHQNEKKKGSLGSDNCREKINKRLIRIQYKKRVTVASYIVYCNVCMYDTLVAFVFCLMFLYTSIY